MSRRNVVSPSSGAHHIQGKKNPAKQNSYCSLKNTYVINLWALKKLKSKN